MSESQQTDLLQHIESLERDSRRWKAIALGQTALLFFTALGMLMRIGVEKSRAQEFQMQAVIMSEQARWELEERERSAKKMLEHVQQELEKAKEAKQP